MHALLNLDISVDDLHISILIPSHFSAVTSRHTFCILLDSGHLVPISHQPWLMDLNCHHFSYWLQSPLQFLPDRRVWQQNVWGHKSDQQQEVQWQWHEMEQLFLFSALNTVTIGPIHLYAGILKQQKHCWQPYICSWPDFKIFPMNICKCSSLLCWL